MTDSIIHAGPPNPASRGNLSMGPGMIKGFGLARDFVARISAPDYSPWRMAALHSTNIEIEVAQLEAERQARADKAHKIKLEKAKIKRAATPEELQSKHRELLEKRKAKRHAANPDMPYKILRTPEERKILARERDQARRDKAKAAATRVNPVNAFNSPIGTRT